MIGKPKLKISQDTMEMKNFESNDVNSINYVFEICS